jgi:hypothetical protein
MIPEACAHMSEEISGQDGGAGAGDEVLVLGSERAGVGRARGSCK